MRKAVGVGRVARVRVSRPQRLVERRERDRCAVLRAGNCKGSVVQELRIRSRPVNLLRVDDVNGSRVQEVFLVDADDLADLTGSQQDGVVSRQVLTVGATLSNRLDANAGRPGDVLNVIPHRDPVSTRLNRRHLVDAHDDVGVPLLGDPVANVDASSTTGHQVDRLAILAEADEVTSVMVNTNRQVRVDHQVVLLDGESKFRIGPSRAKNLGLLAHPAKILPCFPDKASNDSLNINPAQVDPHISQACA